MSANTYITPNTSPTFSDAETIIYYSDYVEVMELVANVPTIKQINSVSNIVYSIEQPNLTVNVGSNRIWFNGYYTTGNTTSIYYFQPLVIATNETLTIAANFDDVPPRKVLYQILEPESTEKTITIDFRVSYNSGGNDNFQVSRVVTPDIDAAYEFLQNYTYHGDD